jgi:hypothetical protein
MARERVIEHGRSPDRAPSLQVCSRNLWRSWRPVLPAVAQISVAVAHTVFW